MTSVNKSTILIFKLKQTSSFDIIVFMKQWRRYCVIYDIDYQGQNQNNNVHFKVTALILFLTFIRDTIKPGFSKLFEKRKNVYYCQVFTIYHVIYAVIANFGKQQKVY